MLMMVASCVPAKRYYEMESSHREMVAAQKSDSAEIKRLRDINGEQLMGLLSLSEDSIHMHYAYDSLMNRHLAVSYSGSIELANARRELDNKDFEVTQKEQDSKKIIYSFRNYDVEINTIARQLERFMIRYKSQGVSVENNYWNVVMTLPTSLIYEGNSYDKLSTQGINIATSIGNLAKQYGKFRIETIEYSEPSVKEIKTQEVHTFEVVDSVKYTHKVDSTIVNTIYLPYSYTGFEKSEKNIEVKMPMRLKKSNRLIQYLKSKDSDIAINGKVLSTRPRGYQENVIQIIIAPRIKSLLTDIGKL